MRTSHFFHILLRRCVLKSQGLIKLIIFTASLMTVLSKTGSFPSLTAENMIASKVCVQVPAVLIQLLLQPSTQCQQSERIKCVVSIMKIVFTLTGSIKKN